MKTFMALLKSGWFIALIGVILLSILVWVGGPYLGIGDTQPLAGAVARLLMILLIIVAWAAWLQILQLRARSRTRQMSADIAGQATQSPAASERDERGSAERAQLQARFQEAIDTLRKSRRGGGNLYTLPWYVVIGPPGSGKSTLLQNSGLHFPLSIASARKRCAALVAPATATGGSPTKRCFWIQPGAIPPRIPTRWPMHRRGSNSSICCADTASGVRSTACSSRSACQIC